jgi:hypothetical protein
MEFPIGYNLYSNETFTVVEKKDILITLFKVMIEFAIRYKKINANLHRDNVIVNKKTNEVKMFGFNWIIDVDTPEELITFCGRVSNPTNQLSNIHPENLISFPQ